MLGFEPTVATSAEREQIRGVIYAAVTARNDVMRGEIARTAALAARAVALDEEPRELTPFGLLALRRWAPIFLG
jgi:hypothetical protein